MSGTIDPPKIIVATLTINNYRYALSNLIPHTSVVYGIDCFNDNVLVKSITGLLEGEQYKEWTTDDWLDSFIKQKVEELPDIQVESSPVETHVETPVETVEAPVETVETPVETPIEPTETPVETVETPVESPVETPETVESPETPETPVETV
jgi:hypothetical protein